MAKKTDMSEFELHREAIESSSPLSLIREKELELNKRVLGAKKTAEQTVAKARQDAETIKLKAIEEGQQEGQKAFAAEIKKAEKDAEAVRKSAAKEVAKATDKAMQARDQAVKQILEAVLP